MEENNTDRFFKKGLEGYSVAPDNIVWDRIESQLPSNSNNGFFASKRNRWAALLLLLLLCGTSTCLLLDNQKLKQEIYALNTELQSMNSPDITDKNIASSEPEPTIVSSVSDSNQRALQPANERITINHSSSNGCKEVRSQNPTQGSDKTASYTISGMKAAQSPGSSSQKSFGDRKEIEQGISHSIDSSPNLSSSFISRMYSIPPGQLSRRSPDYVIYYPQDSPECTFHPSTSIGFNILQNRTFRTIRPSTSEGELVANNLNRLEKPGQTWALGMNLGRQFAKRWKVKSGIEYSQWKQSSEQSIYVMADDGNETVTSLGSPEWNYSTFIESSLGQNPIELQAEFNPANPDFSSNPNNLVEIPVNIQETIDWISIPLMIEYNAMHRRTSLFASAGFAYDLLLKSRTQLHVDNQHTESNSNSASIQKNAYFSTLLEAGIQHQLSNNLRLRLSPRLKTWMEPIYDSGALRSYPYAGSINAEIQFDL